MTMFSILLRTATTTLRTKSTRVQACRKSTVSSSDPIAMMSSMSSDFWGSLRRKAAAALTQSLTPEEQKDLMEKVGGYAPKPAKDEEKKNDDEQQDATLAVKHSIAEAVAQARIEEASQQEKKWEKEREKILAEAERAATERVEHDLRIQKFQRWQEELNKAQTTSTTAEDTAVDVAPAKEATDVATTTAAEKEVHPVLGECLYDLGYKRIHFVSASDLAGIPVWEKQRIYRHTRAKSMARDKKKTLHLGMPGVIGLHEDNDGNLSILDGQHRVGMMSLLKEELEKGADLKGVDLEKILVEVYPQQSEHDADHAKEIFLEVNKAEPVKLVDLPGVAKSKDRNIITSAAESLSKSFPDMFSASQRCRVPNLNVDNVRDALFAANVISRHNLTTAKKLEAWLMEQNELMAAKYQSEEMKATVKEAALSKASKHNFYLGLDSSWYSN